MTPNPILSAVAKFHCLIGGLFAHVSVVAAAGWGWVEVPVITQIWRRIYRLNRRFIAIMAAFEAGTLPAARPSAPRRRATARPHGDEPLSEQLPEYYGWVARTISRAFFSRFELEEMFEDPATEALVAAVPQLGSVFRPLCHMLETRPPAWLRRPRRPRPRKPSRGTPTVIRLGAGDLWRGPSGIWQREEDVRKFDAKTWVYPDELDGRL